MIARAKVAFVRWHTPAVEPAPDVAEATSPDPHAGCMVELAAAEARARTAEDLFLNATEQLRQANVRALLAERARDEAVTGPVPLVPLAPSDTWEGRARRAEAHCALLDDRLARAEGRPTQRLHLTGQHQ